MARRPRLFAESVYHHIYAWGNNRQALFITEQHYAKYLDFLQKYSNDYQVDIIAYALIQTHVHLFVHDLLGKVSRFMNGLHGEYAQYLNRMTGRVGHVFGERFNNRIVQANDYGLWLSRYIHRQAVEAGLVTDPRYYPWTSYQKYLGETPLGFLKPDVVLEQFGRKWDCARRYEEFVRSTENGPIDWDVQSSTVIGTEDFKQEIRQRKTSKHQENLSDKQIGELIEMRFKIEARLLSSPLGWQEKRLRRKIIEYLIDEIGLQRARVAQLCQISRSGVQRVLNAKVQKCMPVPD